MKLLMCRATACLLFFWLAWSAQAREILASSGPGAGGQEEGSGGPGQSQSQGGPDSAPGQGQGQNQGRGEQGQDPTDRVIIKLKGMGQGIGEGLQVVRVKPEAGLQATLEELSNRSDVEYAEPDYLATLDTIPNDPLYGLQWGLTQINADDAWDITKGSVNVSVCVIDSGADLLHQDLRANTRASWSFNAITADNNITDNIGHGTHIAGILGATTSNSLGVAGLNWRVRMFICKFIDLTSNGTSGYVSDAVRCIRFCSNRGARVISASWSMNDPSRPLRDALVGLRDAGVLFVSSAGNNAINIDNSPVYPPEYGLSNQLVVAASAFFADSRLVSKSNFGPTKVHIAAPGDNIRSTLPGNKYDYLSGTSMATPYVSGAAALLLAAPGNLTMPQLRQILLDTAVRSSALDGKVLTGRLDVNAALLSKAQLVSRLEGAPA